MKIVLDIQEDNFNTNPTNKLEMVRYNTKVYLTLEDREIAVDYEELKKALEVL